MVARTVPVPPFDLVVFGGTGDLARRKLLPALYHRLLAGQIPDTARIIGAARSDMDDEAYRNLAREALDTFVDDPHRDPETTGRFLQMLHYRRLDAESPEGWNDLRSAFGDHNGEERPHAFYLSVAPRLFEPTLGRLSESGAIDEHSRVVVEKPLGRDLELAFALNRRLSAVFREDQVFRIDHYLGKETVQNMMVLRFANTLFEPLWNATHIDHVQITVAETVGLEGRGAYYDRNGALRDMVQNHLMQLLCLTAMEPPSRFESDEVRDEKLKILKALKPNDPEALEVVRGQYRGTAGLTSYRDDAENSDSLTESFVAMKVWVENWRWAGVPFYLRTGKRLRARLSEVAIVFKEVPHSIFPQAAGARRRNVLAVRLQPDEGITLGMTIKDPGPGGMRLTSTDLDMTFAGKLGGMRMPDAYERLVMDVIRGDPTLFMRGDEVEAAWAWIDPVIRYWAESSERPQPYDSGSSGPEDALMLMHRDHRKWRDIEP